MKLILSGVLLVLGSTGPRGHQVPGQLRRQPMLAPWRLSTATRDCFRCAWFPDSSRAADACRLGAIRACFGSPWTATRANKTTIQKGTRCVKCFCKEAAFAGPGKVPLVRCLWILLLDLLRRARATTLENVAGSDPCPREARLSRSADAQKGQPTFLIAPMYVTG